MAPRTTNAFLLSFASGHFVDSPKAGPPVAVYQKGRQRERSRLPMHGPRWPKRSISKIYSWSGLHATLKKNPHVGSPNRGPAAKYSSSSKQ